ncbi:LolA family protein [Bartonella ancashensis]|uniref:Outer membrane lipoprotein carrier protein LolA n=1 Tax=Bartonella ancashensis TaxID=1318743 RepID=A0A0M4LJ12_9HYPH|nr:Outer membrane lipoprotein carrier protein LolA [Bartonella ancashensis]
MKTPYILFNKAVFICSFLICATLSFSAFAQSSSQVVRAQDIANHFAAIKTMTGDFVQFGPKGEVTEGTFYLERPGKIRFSYKEGSLRIISDGRSIGINNRSLNNWDLYQLSQTPMKLLLGDSINLSSENLLAFSENLEAITVVLRDKTLGKGYIRMVFEPKTYALQRWTIVDQQNLETTVEIKNVRTGVRFAAGMFKIPYQDIAMQRRRD